MADSETHVEVKVLFDKLERRVLFVEADGYFVDILFSFLTLPFGTIVRLIGKTQSEPSTLGGFTALYQSVMSLSNEYFLRDGLKDMLLHPRNFYEEQCRRLKVNIDDTEDKYFEVTSKDSTKGKVFVAKALKFIITDDLQVTPVLPRTVIGHLNDLGVIDMTVVEERTVKLGINELTELLKLTLLSETPLTDLFVSKKKQPDSSAWKNSFFARGRRIHVKTVINKWSKEFLYCEAGKKFVDFLFSILLVPLGEMLHIIEGKSFLGNIDGLYKSVQSLDSQYFISQDMKNMLLRPKHHATDFTPFIDNPLIIMPVDIEFDGDNGSGGFVKEDILFIVHDDWVVTPASPASAISMMSRKRLSVSDLEERIVSFGLPKGIITKLLSATPLTSPGIFRNSVIFKDPKQVE